MARAIKQYSVTVKSKSHPEWGQRSTMVNAPSKKWIQDNWLQICKSNDLKIVSITLIGVQQTMYAYR